MKPNKNPLWQTNRNERASYYSYFFGQNMIYNIFNTFITAYSTFIFGSESLGKVAVVIAAVKIWDAVNDALFGVIFDKIKFKSGKKYIPWLRIACALTPAATVAFFFIPKAASETVKLILFALGYILWDTAYTLCDVPAFGIITSMTTNIEERNSVLSYKSITGGIGSALTFVLVSVLNNSLGISYGPTSLIIAVIASATMFPVVKFCQERYEGTDEEQFTVTRMFKYLFQNKYLLIFYIGYFFFSGTQTYNQLQTIFAFYIYNNANLTLVTGTIAAVPQLIMSLLVPKMLKKMDKITLFNISVVAAIVTSVALCFTRETFIGFCIVYMLRAIPLGIMGVLAFIFTPDCAEYGRYHSNIDAKGITFAIQTFVVKLAAAASTSIGVMLLSVFKYKTYDEAESFAELAEIGATQTPEALDGLWFTFNIFPIIGLIIALVCWLCYKLKDKDVQVMTDCNNGKITKEEAEKLLSRKY